MALSLDLLSGGGASPINRICPLTSLAVIRARRGSAAARGAEYLHRPRRLSRCPDHPAEDARGIRAIPAGPRTATRAHPLGLTRRKREVLDLICAGHTNAEIAARLFISAKTVDHHVFAVLAKLDAPTRNAAVAAAARLGLADAAKSRLRQVENGPMLGAAASGTYDPDSIGKRPSIPYLNWQK